MSEWWTYRLSDFLMFSPRIYTRLFELTNADAWPLHLLLLPAALWGAVAMARGRGWRACGVGLGAAWLFCAVVFVQARYLPINWAVAYLLPALALLVVLLPLLGWQAGARPGPAGTPAQRAVALALATWAGVLHPLLAPLAGLGWRAAEVFAFAPDPTAIATLAWLVALPRQQARVWRGMQVLAWSAVLAWCVFSSFMLAAMDRWTAGVLPLAVALALLARRWRAHA